MINHRDPELDKFIGQKVKISFKDEHVLVGYLEYIEEFSSKYGFRKPNMYSLSLATGCGAVSFRKSLVRRIEKA